MSGEEQTLVARWVEDDLDEPGRLRLAEAIAVDPRLGRQALADARLAALLRLAWPAVRDGRTAASVERLIQARGTGRRRRLADGIAARVVRRRRLARLRWTALAAAAVLAVATVLLWPSPPQPWFTVIDGQASLAGAALAEGGRLRADAGAFRVGTGRLLLQAEDGSRLALAAGAQAGLDGRGDDGRLQLTLADGRLAWTGDHRPGSSGLRLRTPHGTVLTEGTRFDCRVQADAAVIRLAEGRVRVATGTGADVTLRPGEASIARAGSPPSPPAAFPAGLLWTGAADEAPAVAVQAVPWAFAPGVVPGRTIGRWRSLADGSQACTAHALGADVRWESEPKPDHEVMVHADRDGAALLRLAHGAVLRFRVRAEHDGAVNVTIGVPRAAADLAPAWASSPMVPVQAGVWRTVELPIAGFWSRVKADWEAAAISSIGVWGYGAGGFEVSALEIGLE